MACVGIPHVISSPFGSRDQPSVDQEDMDFRGRSQTPDSWKVDIFVKLFHMKPE
jgi:hypothetical protein